MDKIQGKENRSQVNRMSQLGNTINILRKADAVCFDVDSTICTSEGIDDLANFCHKGLIVKEMYIFI